MSARTIRLSLALGAVLAIASVPVAALAVPLQGTISFGGTVLVVPPNFEVATQLDFVNPVEVLSATGHFAPLTGSTAVFSNITYNPTPLVPIDNLWVANAQPGTYSFDLLEMNVDFKSATVLALSGSGTLHAPNFDATEGTWTLTANTSGGVVFSFSSTSIAAPAPEPGSMVLFVSGMFVIGFALRGARSA